MVNRLGLQERCFDRCMGWNIIAVAHHWHVFVACGEEGPACTAVHAIQSAERLPRQESATSQSLEGSRYDIILMKVKRWRHG